MCRVGQNHIYTVYVRYLWQGNHQIYGHVRSICTVLANHTHVHTMHVTRQERHLHKRFGRTCAAEGAGRLNMEGLGTGAGKRVR